MSTLDEISAVQGIAAVKSNINVNPQMPPANGDPVEREAEKTPKPKTKTHRKILSRSDSKVDEIHVEKFPIFVPISEHLPDDTLFRIGIVLYTLETADPHIAAISHPVSSCVVTSLTVLKSEPAPMDEWLADNNLTPTSTNFLSGENKIDILWGEEGFKEIIAREDVDAVYIIVPTRVQQGYLLTALASGKHVLLKDPVSTPYNEFLELMEYSRRHQKFGQFSTMFGSQHRVKTFLECVLREESFGRIQSLDAMLSVNYRDLDQVGVSLPINENRDCLRRLGRFCVLFGIILFAKVGSHPTSVQVHSVLRGEKGEMLKAEATVLFTRGRVLRFTVEYTTCATRQSLEVRTESRTAAMTDFVIPHRDGLATYRVYEKARNERTGKLEIVSAEAIDVAGGPSRTVMMWRKFAQLCLSFDNDAEEEEVAELANIAIQTKRILLALVKSLNEDGAVISLDSIN